MTLGEQIIQELGRRKSLGLYFNYEGYQRLTRVTNESQLRHFLSDERFEDIPETTNPGVVVDYLEAVTPTFSPIELGWWLICGMISKNFLPMLTPLLALSLMYLAFRRKPRRRLPWNEFQRAAKIGQT